jgi:hypothetical protein
MLELLVSKMCRDCKHTEHEPGQCPYDNCDDSELVRSSSSYQPDDMYAGRTTYTPSRLYTRKGIPRLEFRTGRRA